MELPKADGQLAGLRPAGMPSRLPSLTGMRFIAAFSIFLYHAIDYIPWASQKAMGGFDSVFWESGYTGLSFFFILSGFVLTWAARPTDTPRVFWRRRLMRVYPNHVLTFIAAVLILSYVAKTAIDERAALVNVLLLQAWFPQLSIRTSVNAVSWSLSAELLFYLLFPLLRRLIAKIQPQHLWAWAGGVIALIIIAPMFPGPHQQPMPYVGLTPWQLWFLFHFPPMRLLDFVLGMLLARVVMTGRKIPLSFGGSVAFMIAAYSLAHFFAPSFQIVAVMIIPVAFVVASGAAGDIQNSRIGRKTWLSSPWMILLGDLSYAFYLWHRLVLICAGQWFGHGKAWSTPGVIGALVLMGAVAIALSWLTFKYYEQPLMRRFGESRKARPAQPAPAVESLPAAEPVPVAATATLARPEANGQPEPYSSSPS